MDTDTLELFFDGSCEPHNPGGSACFGWALLEHGRLLNQGKGLICRGEGATNNVAEYSALIHALRFLLERGYTDVPVTVRGDSQLVVRQVNGEYGIFSELLQPLHCQALDLLARLPLAHLEWIPRERNQLADRLSHDAYRESVAHEAGRESAAHEAGRESVAHEAGRESAAHGAGRESVATPVAEFTHPMPESAQPGSLQAALPLFDTIEPLPEPSPPAARPGTQPFTRPLPATQPHAADRSLDDAEDRRLDLIRAVFAVAREQFGNDNAGRLDWNEHITGLRSCWAMTPGQLKTLLVTYSWRAAHPERCTPTPAPAQLDAKALPAEKPADQ